MSKDRFTREWITQQSLDVIRKYQKGVLTLRALHYQLVSRGMTNTVRHYKRVVGAMIKARRDGIVRYEVFSDHDREVLGQTRCAVTDLDDSINEAKRAIKLWMTSYHGNRWENQPVYPEVWIEKKALQGVFQRPCDELGVALAPCKGYPSLTFLNDAADRFREQSYNGKALVILYFGDYDPSGEDIPRSIADNLYHDFGVEVEVKRQALLEQQVIDWGLPPAPAKTTDSRTANWSGLGQVELDAVEPNRLMQMCTDAIMGEFDYELFAELQERIGSEREEYQTTLRKFVNSIE